MIGRFANHPYKVMRVLRGLGVCSAVWLAGRELREALLAALCVLIPCGVFVSVPVWG